MKIIKRYTSWTLLGLSLAGLSAVAVSTSPVDNPLSVTLFMVCSFSVLLLVVYNAVKLSGIRSGVPYGSIRTALSVTFLAALVMLLHVSHALSIPELFIIGVIVVGWIIYENRRFSLAATD